jgi:hypothetical protein
MDLVKKLRLNTDQPLWLINVPDDCRTLFPGFEIKEKASKKDQIPQLMLFVMGSKELVHELSIISAHISPDTVFWICYPKKSGSLTSDLVDTKNWDIVYQSGFRAQTAVSVDENWSGLRVTNAPLKTPSLGDIPMEDRKAEGIDFVDRTVKLPDDAMAEVDKHEGMLAFFNAMSFTHKKEYVLAIVEAKQAETRRRRIEKMVEQIMKKMSEPKKGKRF